MVIMNTLSSSGSFWPGNATTSLQSSMPWVLNAVSPRPWKRPSVVYTDPPVITT